MVAEHLNHLFGLALAQQAVIDMNAHKLLTDRFDQQGGDHRAVYAAREGEQHLFVADLRTKFFDLLVNKRLREFRGGDPFHCFGSYISCHTDTSKMFYIPHMVYLLCDIIAKRGPYVNNDRQKNRLYSRDSAPLTDDFCNHLIIRRQSGTDASCNRRRFIIY